MMTPSLPLQKAVNTALRTHAGVAQSVATRVFDHVPPNAQMPYVKIGDDQIISDFSAGDMFECYVTVHGFSQTAGRVQVKTLAAQIVNALHVELQVKGFDTMEFWLDQENYRTENDGKTEHVILTFYYKLQLIG